jgi:hypothetical protein
VRLKGDLSHGERLVEVLGTAAGSTDAPLAELLARGIGGDVRVLAAAAALLLTLGAMNVYYAGAAKLGAARGRDGALPGWLSGGSSAGAVPRRSLAVASGLAFVALVAAAVARIGPGHLVLFTTGSFVTVYAVGTAAALRLLPRRSQAHRSALVALVAVAALLVLTGWYLLWSLVVTAAALLYLRVRARKPAVADAAVRMSDGASRSVAVARPSRTLRRGRAGRRRGVPEETRAVEAVAHAVATRLPRRRVEREEVEGLAVVRHLGSAIRSRDGAKCAGDARSSGRSGATGDGQRNPDAGAGTLTQDRTAAFLVGEVERLAVRVHKYGADVGHVVCGHCGRCPGCRSIWQWNRSISACETGHG